MKLAIIFDFDGVIVDSLEVWGEAFILACDHHGSGQISTQEAFLDLFENNFFEGAKKIGIDEEKITLIRKKLAEEYLKNKHKISLFKGIKEMLERLAKEHEIFIVSSNFSDIVQHFLDVHGMTMFKEVLGGDKGRSKVNKIESIKVKFPDREFLYVGDTKGDMIEGKLAGVKTVAVTWGWHSEERLREAYPDYVVSAPNELVSLVSNLSEK